MFCQTIDYKKTSTCNKTKHFDKTKTIALLNQLTKYMEKSFQ